MKSMAKKKKNDSRPVVAATISAAYYIKIKSQWHRNIMKHVQQ